MSTFEPTPEQIAAGAEALAHWDGYDSLDAAGEWEATSYRTAAAAVLSAVDLSDHDRAVYEEGREDAYEQGYENGAADALRQAADAAADNCASVLNDDDPTEANRWADTEHWLRARAESSADTPDPHKDKWKPSDWELQKLRPGGHRD